MHAGVLMLEVKVVPQWFPALVLPVTSTPLPSNAAPLSALSEESVPFPPTL